MAPVAKANVYKVNTNFNKLRTRTTNCVMENTFSWQWLEDNLNGKIATKLDNESYVCVNSEDKSCEAWAMDVARTVLRPWTLKE